MLAAWALALWGTLLLALRLLDVPARGAGAFAPLWPARGASAWDWVNLGASALAALVWLVGAGLLALAVRRRA